MHRLVLIAAGIALFVMSPAEAASRHKHKARAAPAAQSAPVMQPAFAKRPSWADPQQCIVDDGYGRYLPCDVGDGR